MTVSTEALNEVRWVGAIECRRSGMDVDIAPGGLDGLAAEGEVVQVPTEERYPESSPQFIGRVLERPCDVVRLPLGDLQVRRRCRVEEQAEVLVVCLGEEDGDRDAVDFCDREATFDDVTADELNRRQIDLSKRSCLLFALVPDSFRRLFSAQQSANGSILTGRRST